MKRNMGYTLIVLGIIFVVVGVFCLTNNKEEKTVTETPAAQSIVTLEPAPAPAENNTLSEAEQKGRSFEEYVVDRFNKKYFTLKEWRGDKFHKGTYAESNRYPDMEWEFSLKDQTAKFAVECKWRSAFVDDYVEWSSEEQMNIYKQFEKDKNMPVFIIIGIGGEPSAPAEVYCVPLKVMKLNKAKQSYIADFKHDEKKRNFFYDVESGVLK